MEPNNDLFKLFFGEDYANRSEKLNNDLLEIERRHIDYFKARPSKLKGQEEHDSLHHHYIIVTDPPIVKFGFIENCDLPAEIQDECLKAFRNCFGNQ